MRPRFVLPRYKGACDSNVMTAAAGRSLCALNDDDDMRQLMSALCSLIGSDEAQIR